MTVRKESKNCSKGPGFHYVRLQNLPPITSIKNIRDFFQDLPIPEGGISLHRTSAFVVFQNEVIAKKSLTLDKNVLEGSRIRVSNAVLKDLRRTQVCEARRKLVFGGPEEVPNFDVARKKRIRPTTVTKSGGNASKRFCPDEIDHPDKSNPARVNGVNKSNPAKNSGVDESNSSKVGVDNKSYSERVTGYGKSNPSASDDDENKPKEINGVDKVRSNMLNSVDGVFSQDKAGLPDGKSKNRSFNVTFKNYLKRNDSQNGDLPVEDTSKNDLCLKKEHQAINYQKAQGTSCCKSNQFSKTQHLGTAEMVLLNNEPKTKLQEPKDKIIKFGQFQQKSNLSVYGDATKISNSVFYKSRIQKKQLPTKKTIKPTSVLTLSQFNLAYEGTVF